MDDRIIDFDAAQQYWKASAQAFMSCYARMEGPERAEREVDCAFPPELEVRARRTIRGAKLRCYIRRAGRALKKMGSYAAVLALLVLVGGGMLLSAEAERTRFRTTEASPFFQLVDDEWLISSSLIPNYRYEGEIMAVAINAEDPLEGLLSEGYVLDIESQHISDFGFAAAYEHPDGGKIYAGAGNLSANTWISAYNAQYMAHVSVCGYPGIIVVNEYGIVVAWVCEKTQKVFELYSSDLPKADVINMATELAKRITK